jgi:cytochrome c biogenesis protein CcmG/thiol:disulfide interchange protein DsbE
MRRLLLVLGAVALVAVVVIGLGQAGGAREQQPSTFDLAQAKQQLEGAPPPLAVLHDQASTILDGGLDAFEQRLKRLDGMPIVINKWASWCRPCRAEFPVFQQVATDRGKEVAFIGVNAGDKRPAAEDFLAERPLPYPSFEDPDEEISRKLNVPKLFPATIFIDARGNETVQFGEYTSREALERDIDRFVGGS